MHRVFISDLHLEDPQSPAFQRFGECVAEESVRVDELYILGDLVEMWVGDDDDSESAQTLIDVLHRSACPVFLLHGNRDFLFGKDFAQRANVTLLDDPHVLDDHVAISHGDALCTDDTEYQAFRTMTRSAEWQADILGKSLAERQAFGRALREQSKSTNANKPTNIMDVNAEATSELLEASSCDLLIHGHTHRPGYHDQRIVLGAWERCGWLCRQIDGAFRLECFGLGSPYVGTPL